MRERVIGGAIIFAVLFLLLLTGGIVLWAGLLVLSLLALHEFCKAAACGGAKPYAVSGYAVTVLLYAALLILALNAGPGAILTVSAFAVILLLFWLYLMIVSVFQYPKHTYTDASLTLTGVIYTAVLFSFIYLLRIQNGGAWYVWYLFIASWGCDTCAYFAGRFFGKHKMAPVLSPKKTMEGLAGGILGAAVLCVVYGLVIAARVDLPKGSLLLFSVLAGVFGAFLGQIGDLFASSIKRTVGIKDYSHLIPGHGGILDRFDSTLLVAPAVTILLLIFTSLAA